MISDELKKQWVQVAHDLMVDERQHLAPARGAVSTYINRVFIKGDLAHITDESFLMRVLRQKLLRNYKRILIETPHQHRQWLMPSSGLMK